jgi:predicted negative regulator of RcsB-dependent stress response
MASVSDEAYVVEMILTYSSKNLVFLAIRCLIVEIFIWGYTILAHRSARIAANSLLNYSSLFAISESLEVTWHQASIPNMAGLPAWKIRGVR